MNYKYFKLLPEIATIEELEVCDQISSVAWFVNARNKDGVALGSGSDLNLDVAHKKALNEALERKIVDELISKRKTGYFIDEFPSTCGFALNITTEESIKSSVFEAAERWVISNWIDNQQPITPIDIPQMPRLSHYLIQNFFESYTFFLKKTDVDLMGINAVNVIIFVGLTKEGAFLGSRGCLNLDSNAIDHAVTEAYRHLRISQVSNIQSPLVERIRYFSKGKKSALSQIPKGPDVVWKRPKLKIFQKVKEAPYPFKMYRTLFEGYVGWHVGGKNRFVY